MSRQAKPSLKLVPSARPDLHVHSDYAAVATAVLGYLRDHAELYRYGGRLAFIKRDDDGTPTIRIADVHDIRMVTADYMQPFIIKGKDQDKKERKDIALPTDVANLMLAAVNDIAAFRPLVGVTTAPLLREDGSICVTDGYDADSQLFCDYTDLPALDIKDAPTKDDAKASLRALRKTFEESPFADRKTDRENPETTDLEPKPGPDGTLVDPKPDHDESVFLNQLLLGVCRPSMELAPAVIVRATDGNSGAGKTTLARAIAYIAFGRRPRDTAFGTDMAEFDKTLLSELRTGPACVLFDNGNELTLRSNLLNLVLTSGRAGGRVLGSSEMADLETRSLILLTGNALGVSADDIRRVLVSNLDARTEDPERRQVSKREFIDEVMKPRRAELLQHLLTIWCWGRLHENEIKKGEGLMSFDTYTRWVRDPLLALGCKDPVSRIDELKMTDPKRELQAAVFREWMHAHPSADIDKAGLETAHVTANRLSTSVCSLIDPNHAKNNNKKVIATLTAWRGVHVAGFVLKSDALTKGKWTATKYWLIRKEKLQQEEPEEKANRQQQTEKADGQDAAVEPVEDSTTDDPDADAYQFNREDGDAG